MVSCLSQNLSSNVRSGLEESHNEHLGKMMGRSLLKIHQPLEEIGSGHVDSIFFKVPVYEIIQNPISFM